MKSITILLILIGLFLIGCPQQNCLNDATPCVFTDRYGKTVLFGDSFAVGGGCVGNFALNIDQCGIQKYLTEGFTTIGLTKYLPINNHGVGGATSASWNGVTQYGWIDYFFGERNPYPINDYRYWDNPLQYTYYNTTQTEKDAVKLVIGSLFGNIFYDVYDYTKNYPWNNYPPCRALTDSDMDIIDFAVESYLAVAGLHGLIYKNAEEIAIMTLPKIPENMPQLTDFLTVHATCVNPILNAANAKLRITLASWKSLDPSDLAFNRVRIKDVNPPTVLNQNERCDLIHPNCIGWTNTARAIWVQLNGTGGSDVDSYYVPSTFDCVVGTDGTWTDFELWVHGRSAKTAMTVEEESIALATGAEFIVGQLILDRPDILPYASRILTPLPKLTLLENIPINEE